MFEDYTIVRLTTDVQGYATGSTGTIVATFSDPVAYLIETEGAVDIDGLVTVTGDQIEICDFRPLS